MQNKARRAQIIDIIRESGVPVPGAALAERLGVSRQIIVQDIALIRAEGYDVISTNRGYLLTNAIRPTRVFKVRHDNDRLEEELVAIVEMGGTVLDVFIRHDVYGKVSGRLDIDSKRKIDQFMENIRSGKSQPLSNITAGYHYHTVEATDTSTLDLIQQMLKDRGFLAQ